MQFFKNGTHDILDSTFLFFNLKNKTEYVMSFFFEIIAYDLFMQMHLPPSHQFQFDFLPKYHRI